MFRSLSRLLVLPLAFGFLSILPSAAQDSGKGIKERVVDVVFSELERQIMSDYFGKNRLPADEATARDDRKKGKKVKKRGKGKDKKRGLPPGLAKKKRLPPGLARQLDRNGTLPPGLAKRDLPRLLEASLPDPWPGTERKIIDNNVVLLEKGTNLILDVLRDVVLR